METVRSFAWFAGAIFGLAGALFCIVEVKFGGFKGLFKKAGAACEKVAWPMPAQDETDKAPKVHWYAMLTPLVPLVAVWRLRAGH